MITGPPEFLPPGSGPADAGRAAAGTLPGRAFTLLELLVTVAIVAMVTLIALPHFQLALTRSRLAASKNNIRLVSEALEVYRMDQRTYPQPVIVSLDEDPYGVIATSSLRGLTTPIAYVSATTLRDSFGFIQAQTPGSTDSSDDPFRPPTPSFNTAQSLLYFYYPRLAVTIGDAALRRECYAMVSVGPDLKDSFIVYYPFPASLPATAAQYGITRIEDTVYDPTNGIVSGGDLAGFGFDVQAPRLIGGGWH